MYIIQEVQIQYYDTYFLPKVSFCLYGMDSKHYELKIMQFSDPLPRKVSTSTVHSHAECVWPNIIHLQITKSEDFWHVSKLQHVCSAQLLWQNHSSTVPTNSNKINVLLLCLNVVLFFGYKENKNHLQH
jgi:hypothetical protein